VAEERCKQGLICPVYNTSKAGVIQLARNLASEWGEHNIRVNTLSPGYIVTAMVEELFKQFPERREEWPKQNMLGRLSGPREYRGAGVFLLSDASSFMVSRCPNFVSTGELMIHLLDWK
jgi:NAD(P)-dependent dehydrogenase (short-subunit alcohol dehydrogenase family)